MSDESQETDTGRSWCPISKKDELWINQRFEWLIETFGFDVLWKARFVRPCEADFPDPFRGTEEDTARLFSRVCNYLDLDVNRLQLGFFSGDDPLECELARIPFDAVGLYESDKEKPRVWLDRLQLEDPVSLVATIAHELCHDILLGGGKLDPEVDTDHEYVTDLLTIYLGFGVFTANSYLRENSWHGGGWEFSQTSRQGYFELGALAYSLALAGWYRNEVRPEWISALRPDLRDLVPRHLNWLYTRRGEPDSSRDHSLSAAERETAPIASDLLRLPEIVVPDETDNEVDGDSGVVTVQCVCPSCQSVISFPITQAGETESCPICSNYVDVPELSSGRYTTLKAKQQYRQKLSAEQVTAENWIRHNLTLKWRALFGLGFLIVVGHFMWITNYKGPHDFATGYVLGVFLGAVIGFGFAFGWHRLRNLERGYH